MRLPKHPEQLVQTRMKEKHRRQFKIIAYTRNVLFDVIMEEAAKHYLETFRQPDPNPQIADERPHNPDTPSPA